MWTTVPIHKISSPSKSRAIKKKPSSNTESWFRHHGPEYVTFITYHSWILLELLEKSQKFVGKFLIFENDIETRVFIVLYSTEHIFNQGYLPTRWCHELILRAASNVSQVPLCKATSQLQVKVSTSWVLEVNKFSWDFGCQSLKGKISSVSPTFHIFFYTGCWAFSLSICSFLDSILELLRHGDRKRSRRDHSC